MFESGYSVEERFSDLARGEFFTLGLGTYIIVKRICEIRKFVCKRILMIIVDDIVKIPA